MQKALGAVQWILIALTSVALAACTDGNPSLSILSSIDGITFSAEKKSSEVYTVSTMPSCAADLTIKGQCDRRFNQLQFSIDGEATWTSITGYNTNSNGDCADGEFSLYFPNACTTFNVSSGADISKKILIRAEQKMTQNTTREATVNFSSNVVAPTPIASVDNVSLTEGNTFSFTISLSSPSVGMTTVNYTFSHTTTVDGDFVTVPSSGMLTIADGATSGGVTFVSAQDTIDEDDQSFNITLSSASGANISITNYVGTGTIVDDDAAPTISLTTSSAALAENTTAATFSATLSSASEKPISFKFDTADGGAVAPEDYTTATNLLINVLPGATTATINVALINDTIDEPKQCFAGTIGTATNASILVNGAVVCITDDDAEPTLSIADATAIEGAAVTHVLTLSAASQQTFSIDYTLTHGTTVLSDFTGLSVSSSISFPVNTTTKNLVLNTNDDALAEGVETFTVTLSNPLNTFAASFKDGNITVSDATAAGVIDDNEFLAPTLSLVSTGSPGISARPTIRASGLLASDQVKIYSDSVCTNQIHSGVSSGTTLDFILPALTPGAYKFFATRFDGTLTSGCSAAPLNYTYAAAAISALYPLAGPNWNDYVAFSDSSSSIYKQADSACIGNETGHTDQFGGCIHGAEKKKITLTGMAGCNGITAADALGAFNWQCTIVSSSVTLVSKGLKPGKGLRDLIDGSTKTWISNSVTVYQDGTDIGSTASSSWWSNPIVELSGPLNNSGTTSVVNLSNSGSIYVITGDQPTFGYSITADKISVVTLGPSGLRKYEPTDSFNCQSSTGLSTNSASDDIDTVLCAGNRKYLWIEARINGISTFLADYGIFLTNTNRSQIRNSVVYDLSHDNVLPAVQLYNSHGNLISGLTIHSAGSGLLLQTSANNTIENISVSHTYGPMYSAPYGIEVNGASATGNHFSNVRISNHGYGSQNAAAIQIKGPRNIFSKVNISNVLGSSSTFGIRFGAYTGNENILSQVIVAGATQMGIIFDGDSIKNILSNVTVANNTYGIYFYGISGTPKYNSMNSVAIHNSTIGIYNDSTILAGPHYNILSDLYLSSMQTAGISFQDSNFATHSGYLLHSDTCGDSFGVLYCSTAGAQSAQSLVSGGLTGPIFVDDTVNPEDTAGEGNFAGQTMNGMLKFEHWYRGWGQDHSLGSTSAIGASSGILRIWDFSPVAGGKLNNRSGVATAVNDTLVLDGTACVSNAVSTSNTLTVNGITFFKNAIEIDGDFIGNDNELCEANEHCYYAPNIGAVQPDGALSPGYCIISGDTRLHTRN